MPRKTVYNNITSPELIQQVSKENKELINEFIDYLKSIDRSPTTINGYINDLNIFFVWNLQNNNNKFFIDINKRDIMKYQNYLINTLKHSPNRVRRLKAAISSMSNFIESMMDDLYPDFKNIVNKIPAPSKVEVREKTVLTEEQVQNLLQYLVDNKKYQQACVLALALASGARKSELLRFKVSYFTDDNIIFGSLYKTPEKIKTKGMSSKGKPLYKYTLVKRFKPYFDLWMKQREELGISGDELFWNYRNGVWKPATITLLNSYALTFSKILGIDFYFHSCRHFWTTYLSEAGLPPEVIKKISGWESLDMVSLYTDTDIDDELGKYFNEDGIKQAETKSLSEL
jgi:integrase